MLASLAFPYTLDTGETITEGMGMECLTGDHTPKTDPRHNLVVTAPPYKTRGGSTIAQKAAYFYKNIMQTKCFFRFSRLRLFAPPRRPSRRGSLPAPPAAVKGASRWPPATPPGSRKLRGHG